MRASRQKPPPVLLVPLSTPSQADSASLTRTLSSQADSPSPMWLSSQAALSSPTPRPAPGKVLPTTATLERAIEGVHIAAKSNNVCQPGTSNLVNDWQATVPGAYPMGTPYSDDKVTTNTHHNRKETVVPQQPSSRLQCRSSGRPLHLQGLKGSFGVRLSSATTVSFDWEDDVESVLPESVIATVEWYVLTFHCVPLLTCFSAYNMLVRQLETVFRRLVPIIRMGPACEAAIEKTGLPDTVHTALCELVLTQVNTSWLRQLKDKLLFLSDNKA